MSKQQKLHLIWLTLPENTVNRIGITNAQNVVAIIFRPSQLDKVSFAFISNSA